MKKDTKKMRRGAGRVAFLAEREAIAALVLQGHPLRSVFDRYQGRLGIGYPQFTKYVNRYIRSDETDAQDQKRSPAPASAAARPADKRQEIRPGKDTPFKFDPTAGHNRDDLI